MVRLMCSTKSSSVRVWPTEGMITLPVAIKVGNQSLCSMSNVLEFAAFHLTWLHGERWMESFQGLDARHFVGAHDKDSVFLSRWSHGIGLTDAVDLFVEDLRIVIFGIEPITRQMGFDGCFFLKSAPQCGAKSRSLCLV